MNRWQRTMTIYSTMTPSLHETYLVKYMCIMLKGELRQFLTALSFSWGWPHGKKWFDVARNLHWLPALRNSYNANLWGQALYPLLGPLNTFRKPFQDLCNTSWFLTRHHRAHLTQRVWRNSINIVFLYGVTHLRLPRWRIQKALADSRTNALPASGRWPSGKP